MKKIIMIVTLITGTLFTQAQKHKVVSAYNYLKKNQLAKALKAIEPATEHNKTKNDAKTWYYRGNIYLSIQLSDKEDEKKLAENPLDEAYESYKKAMELDQKGKYKKDLRDRMQYTSEQYFNQGVNTYKSQDYKTASKSFELAYTINKDYRNVIDTAAIYYAGNSADLGKDKDRALTLYKKALDLGYNKPSLYALTAQIYTAKSDTAAALNVLAEGKKRFPGNFNIIISETNIFLSQGDSEKALANLKLALQKDDKNPEIWFAAGSNYEKMIDQQKDEALKKQMRDEAINAYKKSLELKPDYFNPAFNLGAVYVNHAATLQSEANNLPIEETEKYDKMKAEADEALKKAIPYLEKAHQIQPEDTDTLNSLKEIYARLKMNDKLKETNDKLRALQN